MDDVLEELSPQEGYDRWATGYDEYDNPLVALEEPIVRALMGAPVGLRAADIGCGTGRHALWLAGRGATVTGVDFSNGMLGVLRQKRGDAPLELVEHDLAEGVPLPSDTFDLVTCCLVLEHVANLDDIVAELGRICAPGGRVIISDLHPEMVRRGFHARFRERPYGPKRQIRGAMHRISDYIMATVRAGLEIEHASEHEVTTELVEKSASARKWLGEPLLFVLALAR